ncbi:MAG: hypothetical protein NC184_00330 [Roseburia sp.]|nr:hypothetical protein [Roseburia sp.]
MKINAFCTVDPILSKKACDRLIYCGEPCDHDGIVSVPPYSDNIASGEIYLPDMCFEDDLEDACDYLLNSGARAIVRAAYELDETGRIEARYKLSPIMLLHKIGVLSACTIVGGVCLDNDDLDLMAQENVPLVITPTASAGYGHGFAPVCAALRRGIRVGIGTFDNKYNVKADLDREIEFLRLVTNAEMSMENSLSDKELDAILGFERIN